MMDISCNAMEPITPGIEKEKDANLIDTLKERIGIPLEADIHFDYRLALLSIEKEVDSFLYERDRKKIDSFLDEKEKKEK